MNQQRHYKILAMVKVFLRAKENIQAKLICIYLNFHTLKVWIIHRGVGSYGIRYRKTGVYNLLLLW